MKGNCFLLHTFIHLFASFYHHEFEMKIQKFPRDIKAFTTEDIQILEKVVTLKRLEMMESGKIFLPFSSKPT